MLLAWSRYLRDSRKSWICTMAWTLSSGFPLSHWRGWIRPVALSLGPDEDVINKHHQKTKTERGLSQIWSGITYSVLVCSLIPFSETNKHIVCSRQSPATLKQQPPHAQTTFCGVFLGAASLVKQDGSDEDHHLHHNGKEGLQGCVERDDLRAAGAEECSVFQTFITCANIKVRSKQIQYIVNAKRTAFFLETSYWGGLTLSPFII